MHGIPFSVIAVSHLSSRNINMSQGKYSAVNKENIQPQNRFASHTATALKLISVSRIHSVPEKKDGFSCGSSQEQDRKLFKNFTSELNHPLMPLDCQKNLEGRSLTPMGSGVSTQASSRGHYQKYKQQSQSNFRGVKLGGSSSQGSINNEPRGTKRHYPLPCPSPRPVNPPSTSVTTTAESSVVSRPKQRYQEIGEGLPPIVPSACHLNINIQALRPDNLLNGGEWDRLSHAIWTKFVGHEQTPETLKRKFLLREKLHNYIRSCLHEYHLHIVGSSVSGFGVKDSDMDLCLVILSTHEIDQRSLAPDLLDRLKIALGQYRFLTELEVIRAKVPILRFRDTCTNIKVDLNVNNIYCIRNTHLLKAYAQLDWKVRPLTLAVKLWAREHDINDAKSRTLSSYSLTLMVIHYLQCGIHPPVLPCLHKVRMERFWPEGDIGHLVPFTDEELKPLRSTNNWTLGQLFSGFLDYFASKFNYRLHAISIRTGGTLPIDQCRRHESPKNEPHQWNHLCIEDPFDRSNAARSVYDPVAFKRIIAAFCSSAAEARKRKEFPSRSLREQLK